MFFTSSVLSYDYSFLLFVKSYQTGENLNLKLWIRCWLRVLAWTKLYGPKNCDKWMVYHILYISWCTVNDQTTVISYHVYTVRTYIYTSYDLQNPGSCRVYGHSPWLVPYGIINIICSNVSALREKASICYERSEVEQKRWLPSPGIEPGPQGISWEVRTLYPNR